MKRISFFIVLGVVIAFLFSGCTGGKVDKRIPIKVSYWGSVEEIEIMKSLFKKVEETYTNIRIIPEHVPIGNDISKYTSKILTEIAAGTAPDIIFCEVNLFVDFYFKNTFLDLTPFIKKDKSFNIKTFFPEVVKRFTRKGKIYVIPRDTAPYGVIYYNKTLFDKSGVPYPTDKWTWDDLVRIGKKLTKKNPATGVITQYGFYAWAFANFIYSAGGNFVDNIDYPTKCTLDTKEAREGIQFYYDLMYKYKIAPTPASQNIGTQVMFETGKLAMYGSGIWETPRFRKITSFKWDVVAFPRHPKKGLRIGTGGSGYGIYEKTKHPEEAWKVLKILSGKFGQEKLADTGLAQPSDMEIAKGKHWAKSPLPPAHKDVVNMLVKHTVYDPFHPEWQEVLNKYVNSQLQLYFLQKQSLDTTIKNIVKNVNPIFKK